MLLINFLDRELVYRPRWPFGAVFEGRPEELTSEHYRQWRIDRGLPVPERVEDPVLISLPPLDAPNWTYQVVEAYEARGGL